MPIEDILFDAEVHMEKAIEHLQHELRGIRTGRATPALVENIKVDYYDSPTDLRSIASISVPETTQLLIKPFSPGDLKAIEKAISDSKLGLTPHSDGKTLRLMLPPLSQERRLQLVGQCKQFAEASKISIRNARRDANKIIDTVRSPLNAILGWLRIMRNEDLDETKKERALEIIERNAEAQSQLVADLLDVSSVITGKIRINPSQIDLADVVEMAIEGLRPAAAAKSISIEVQLDREGAAMRGDGERLQQVMSNLLANAVKFTPKEGKVTIGLRRVQSDLEVTVSDNGEGIVESFLPHVFDSFRQADASATRSHMGLGIGLSIAKHIVELHGGSIEAHSAGSGRGATFVVRLPVSPFVSTNFGVSGARAAKEQAANISPPTGLGGLRVLVVDDDPDARDLFAYALESYGMEVHVASSSAEALTELETFTPHVIISDISMPHEDGYVLIRSIRNLPREETKNIPAIALTASARNEDRARALVEGF